MKTLKVLSKLFVLIMCLALFNSCSKNAVLDNSEKRRNIALIVGMNNGYHWGTVKMGADTAGREFNVNIDYNGPNYEDDIQGQIKLVSQALEKKVDALILAASDYNALAEVTEEANAMNIPVISIDSEVNTKKICSYIASDNLNAGQKAGELLVKLVGEDCQIGIMSSVKGSRNVEQREEGLLDMISKYPGIKVVEKEYCSSDAKLASSLTKEILSNHPSLGAIVALNSISSEGVAETIDQLNLAGKVKIISFDNTPKEIDYLEKEVIQALITQDPFSMGYLGVKYAVDAINGKSIPKHFYTRSTIINLDNMYLPENQKLLFPFVK